ncbi:MAG: global cell cycle regulator GcrA-like protein [Proteobacteria bacterium]|nr:global cell cycle regulator GcrA-like protein [Pseudomonadota bacterium]MDA1355155.1 global cell cycle regulator GcrA-like protein [Pseudomonadota bacterium]
MSIWTPERIAEVTRLWSEGLTTAEIGKIVGITKNAVVGKAHRLGLPARPSPIRRQGVGSSAVAAPRPVAKVLVKLVRQIALSTSGACCKWPFGHPGEENYHFCGNPALANKPYCPEHYQIAYLPARARGERKEPEMRETHQLARPQRSATAA